MRGIGQGVAVVEVAGDQFGAERPDRLGAVRSGVANERAHGYAGGEQRAGGGAALLSGGAGDEDGCGVCSHEAAPEVREHETADLAVSSAIRYGGPRRLANVR
ncbi:hypothetical protein GCM10009560_49950 [Nonomuraea longicatena]|uniref:Uncharacterized protein n=1 Tax=Nonomuraea longicatena TaxID=83682 RepID=A0ABN1Q8Z8_9ACTN